MAFMKNKSSRAQKKLNKMKQGNITARSYIHLYKDDPQNL